MMEPKKIIMIGIKQVIRSYQRIEKAKEEGYYYEEMEHDIEEELMYLRGMATALNLSEQLNDREYGEIITKLIPKLRNKYKEQ